jgi:predicted metal-dependent enzyme (double-stranded beta helix superfamily)
MKHWQAAITGERWPAGYDESRPVDAGMQGAGVMQTIDRNEMTAGSESPPTAHRLSTAPIGTPGVDTIAPGGTTGGGLVAESGGRTHRKLPSFIAAFDALLDGSRSEPEIVAQGKRLLAELVAVDDWLPPELAVPSVERFQQYPLHVDPAGRFSVVSFVWGPGQSTPIHDHTVWGLIGMLRGAEYSQSYRFASPTDLVASGLPLRLEPGQVEAVSPTLGDVHRVSNAFDDRVSISVHVYGADIGTVRRSVYAEDGSRRDFVSGYSAVPSAA